LLALKPHRNGCLAVAVIREGMKQNLMYELHILGERVRAFFSPSILFKASVKIRQRIWGAHR
jgi:hypothetical protein